MNNNRITIQVKSSKPIDRYSKQHVLIYNSSDKTYEMQEREDFLAPQNRKIQDLEEHIEKINEDFENYKNEINSKFNEFLKTYQETNKKIINMVKGDIE